jgi:hypothetical protein
MMVAIVKAAATMAVPPAAIRNPEHALHGAHGTTDPGAYRAANRAADGSGNPVAFRGPLLRAPHDALRVPNLRDRE